MRDTIEITTKANWLPFDVPDHGTTIDDCDNEQFFPIEDMEPHVLDALAGRWLDNLYASANRNKPWTMVAVDKVRVAKP